MYLGINHVNDIDIMTSTEKKTTVALSEETKEQLANFGKKGESFDSIIQNMISKTGSLCNLSEPESKEMQEE